MNTDKIYAEQLANEYALKDTSKVIALLAGSFRSFTIAPLEPSEH